MPRRSTLALDATDMPNRHNPAVVAFVAALASLLLTPLAHSGIPALDQAVKARLKDARLPTYRYALVDLDGDSVPDAVVLLTDPDFCGSGGCTMMVFRGMGNSYKHVSTSTITREPIFLLPETRHGWHTLSVLVAGGGAHSGQVLMRFNGVRYPPNPSRQTYAGKSVLESAQQLLLR